MLGRHGFERVEHGNLVATYTRSKFEDTRRKALKYGAHGATVKAYRPGWETSPTDGHPLEGRLRIEPNTRQTRRQKGGSTWSPR